MRKYFAMLLAFVVALVGLSAMPVSAAAQDVKTVNGDASVMAEGLIGAYYINISNVNGQLCLNGQVRCDNEMASLGFKELKIEQSTNGSNWTTYRTLGDILTSNDKTCRIEARKESVQSGYYYRVTCTYYAKEKGLLGILGKTQTEPGVSNTLRIS